MSIQVKTKFYLKYDTLYVKAIT